ncbi:MAG TPA: oxygenase MpaB family protein [Pseudomonadales bacterium]|nr:oxygenase MpaB family protein [Pseudomonadales bacterium]
MKTLERVDRDPTPIKPGTLLWDEFGDVLTHVFSGGAFMLQVMHPMINRVVDMHSDVFEDPIGRALRNTDSIVKWIYGGDAAIEEGRRLIKLHAAMKGISDTGEAYHAIDQEAYGWVHATAFVTATTIYPYIHGRRLTAREEAAYYDEMLHLGAILRIHPSQLPASVKDYWDYYNTMVSEKLSRTKMANLMLGTVSRMDLPMPPTIAKLTLPLRRLGGQAAMLFLLGGMTQSARDKLGVRWTSAHENTLRSLMAMIRPVHSRLPESIRYVPIARHARAHARALEAIDQRSRKVAPPARTAPRAADGHLQEPVAKIVTR